MSSAGDGIRIDPLTGEILSDTEASHTANVIEYSVSEISTAIRRTMEDTFGHVRVRGEVGRVSRPASGHIYLDLKDERAVLAAVIWKGTAARLKMLPEQGLEVIATGRITTYAGQSKYQLVIERLEPAGIGALMALLEERRRKLAAEGLFDAARKKKLPWLPQVIGVVTSPSGAVIRDILHRLADRFPRHVLVWPVRVQGDTCAAEVARAIAGFNALPADGSGPVPRPDIIIVARGGGSLEDLWGFNEEIVVRAAAASDIPLISAVGHETDTTLIDLAADKRAPTPTAAAEMAVPVRAELLAWVNELGARLLRALNSLLKHDAQRLLAAARALPRPEDFLGLARQRLDHAGSRLRAALMHLAAERARQLAGIGARLAPGLLRRQVQERRTALERMQWQLNEALRTQVSLRRQRLAAVHLSPALPRRALEWQQRHLQELHHRLHGSSLEQLRTKWQHLAQLARTLESLSPKKVLARGYALVHDATSEALITTAAAIAPGQRLRLEFGDGSRHAVAESNERKPSVRGQAVSGAAAATRRSSRSGSGNNDTGSQGSLF